MDNLLVARRAPAVLAFALTLACSTLPAQGAALPGAYVGEAFGSYIHTEGGPVSLDRNYSGRLVMTCPGTSGKTISKTINGVSGGEGGIVLSVDKMVTTLYSAETASTAEVRNTSTLLGVRVLGGLITADKVVAVAALSAKPGVINASVSGSTFVNLKIAGKTIPLSSRRNTKIGLPNIGTVTVNRVVVGGSPSGKARAVRDEVLRIEVLKANRFNLPAGSVISIGSAYARFDRGPFDAFVGGEATGSSASGKVTNALSALAARSAPLLVGCTGTDGQTLSKQVSTLNVPNILSSGVVDNTAISNFVAGGATMTVTSQVESVSLLSGLVRATSIRAVARDVVKDGKRTSSAAGSSVQGLRIGLLPIISVPANTRLDLPGIGFLVANEQILPPANSRKRTVVNGLRIHVTTANALGLAVGTDIILGHAESAAYPVSLPAAGS
jgi:hypothetical protein